MIPFSSLSSIPVPIPGLLVNLNSIRRHANEAGLPSAIKIDQNDRHDKADLCGPLIPNRSDVRFQTSWVLSTASGVCTRLSVWNHTQSQLPSLFPATFVALHFIDMASREADKPLLLSAILESKDEVAIIRLFFLIFFSRYRSWKYCWRCKATILFFVTQCGGQRR